MNRIVSFLISLLLFSCTRKNGSDTIFNSIPSMDSNITFSNNLKENDSLNYFTYGYMYMGGGVAAGDFNNDDLVDLYFTGNMVPNKLYLNKGNLQFEDISEKAMVQGNGSWYTGVTTVDINNDGYLDIYCSVSGKFGSKKNQLFINNKDNTFSEQAEKYGIADAGNSVQSTFFDYDKDGDLDLYVANYPETPFNAPNSYYVFKKINTPHHETDKLFRNEGTSFVDVTEASGLKTFGLSLSATVGDINQDGWPDIYVSSDFSTPDLFYINNKNGTFSEQSKKITKNTSFYGMGVDISDINNDGLLDIFQVDMSAKDNRRAKANMASMNPALFWGTVNSGFHYQYMQNSLQLNNGVVNDSLVDFSNISRLAGVSSTDWSWGPIIADMDNDGWKDIFVANGTRREINNQDYFKSLTKSTKDGKELLKRSLSIPSEKIDNFMLKNNQDLSFSLINKDWGIEYKGFSNGSVYVDLDNDGDLEIVVNNIDDEASIFENRSASNYNYLNLKFNGPKNNLKGIGVKASVYISENKQQFQELTLSRGFQSSVDPRLHFGLAKQNIIDTLKIEWPDGKTELQMNIKANQFLTIDYKNATNKETETRKKVEKIFKTENDTLLLPKYRHVENYFDDFKNEILLPHKTSMFGPCVAVGDLNGDKFDDFIIGGAAGSPAGIFYYTNSGFEKQKLTVIEKDKSSEDIGILIFDADNDKDNDIYVVSGGNEFKHDSPLLQDRLYINKGNGEFIKSIDALPELISSGSKVKACDFDKDGDLDLFVGGRLIPGNYPLPANSYILENVSKNGQPKFVNKTAEIAKDLTSLGMVTDAIWTDFDNDGWMDLMITGEWMPITVFKNKKGKFEQVNESLKLKDTRGWWFSITEGDFDKDGDMDYVAGNLGMNYKYKANGQETFDIYFDDFDGNKKKDIVLSYYNDGKKYPVRGRECSSQQMPAIKKKFKDYESFSTATLVDVYTEKSLEKSLHYKVKSFASAYIENKGDEFKVHKLPKEAQFSSINKILVKDFDKDTNLDILIAGNLYASEVETPRNDASNGLLLTGNGKGSFQPIKIVESGFFANGDVKDMNYITIDNQSYILIGKNNDFIQWVKF